MRGYVDLLGRDYKKNCPDIAAHVVLKNLELNFHAFLGFLSRVGYSWIISFFDLLAGHQMQSLTRLPDAHLPKSSFCGSKSQIAETLQSHVQPIAA